MYYCDYVHTLTHTHTHSHTHAQAYTRINACRIALLHGTNALPAKKRKSNLKPLRCSRGHQEFLTQWMYSVLPSLIMMRGFLSSDTRLLALLAVFVRAPDA
jgi:hypothetical protein